MYLVLALYAFYASFQLLTDNPKMAVFVVVSALCGLALWKVF